MESNPLTISSLEPLLWDGESLSYQKLKRIILQEGVPAVDSAGRGGSLRYNVDDVAAAVTRWNKNNGNTSRSSKSVSINKLKEEKLTEEIKKLRSQQELSKIEIERSRIQVEELKKNQIDTRECTEFLLFNLSYQESLLRRLMLVNIPIETEGLDIRRKRDLMEKMYNEVIAALNKSISEWRKYIHDRSTDSAPSEEVLRYIRQLDERLGGHADI